jgi:exonuclease III
LDGDPHYNFSNSLYNLEYFNISQQDVDDSPHSNLQISCHYTDETSFKNTFYDCKNFSFLSLNIQSLPAIFNKFSEMIDSFSISKCSPDVILLQEVWQPCPSSFFSHNGYLPIECKTRANNVQGGGVALYFKNDTRFNILHDKCISIDRVFESILAEVWISPKEKILIGSIYRPNVNHLTLTSGEQFLQFFDLFQFFYLAISTLMH